MLTKLKAKFKTSGKADLPHESNKMKLVLTKDGHRKHLHTHQSPNSVAFVWIDMDIGNVFVHKIDRKHSIIDEGELLIWLKHRLRSSIRATLIINSWGGIGGFSDKIAYFILHVFGLTKFAELGGHEGYCGISASAEHNKFQLLRETALDGLFKVKFKLDVRLSIN